MRLFLLVYSLVMALSLCALASHLPVEVDTQNIIRDNGLVNAPSSLDSTPPEEYYFEGDFVPCGDCCKLSRQVCGVWGWDRCYVAGSIEYNHMVAIIEVGGRELLIDNGALDTHEKREGFIDSIAVIENKNMRFEAK